MKEVYVLLTCTGTIFSKAIKHLTKSEYTHSSISLDINCSGLYSFARRQVFPPLPAGFVKEDLSTGILAKYSHCKCAMYKAKVDDATYAKIAMELKSMAAVCDSYPYSCVGPICCFLHIPYHSTGKFFCSEFVADILERNGAINLSKPASLMRPNDFTKMDDLELVFKGTLDELAKKIEGRQMEMEKAPVFHSLSRKTAAY